MLLGRLIAPPFLFFFLFLFLLLFFILVLFLFFILDLFLFFLLLFLLSGLILLGLLLGLVVAQNRRLGQLILVLEDHFPHVYLGVIIAGLLFGRTGRTSAAAAAGAALLVLAWRGRGTARRRLFVHAALTGTPLLALIQINQFLLGLAVVRPLRGRLLAAAALVVANRIGQYRLLLLVVRRLGEHGVVLLVNDLLAGIILSQAEVPGYARHRRHRAELMDDVAGQEVDVVVAQLDAGIADAFAPQLVELGVLDPLHALRDGRFVQVQLQHLHHLIEVLGGECHHILGDAVLVVRLSAVHGLQNAWE